MAAAAKPLPSDRDPEPEEPEAAEPDEGTDESEDDAPEAEPAAPPARPPPPKIKASTMLLFFLGALGLIMVVDTQTRIQVASLIGLGLSPLIGFGGHYILLTMFLAAAIEMALTAVAYNYTTDWVKAAKLQSWSQSLRKLQMTALRSGKKDRIAALKVHQEKLARLSGEVSIAQFKGMAITWFLVIAIYSWVGIEIAIIGAAAATVNLGGLVVNLETAKIFNLIPAWFLLFSVYTVPLSLVFRRILKNRKLRQLPPVEPAAGPAPAGAAGGAG